MANEFGITKPVGVFDTVTLGDDGHVYGYTIDDRDVRHKAQFISRLASNSVALMLSGAVRWELDHPRHL